VASTDPELIPSIKRKFGQNVIVFPVPYGEHMEEEYKKQIATTDLLVIWINLESLFPDIWNELFSHKKIKQELINSIIDLCERLRCELSAISKGKMLWLLFEDYYTQFYNVFGSIKTENYIIDSINNILLEKFNEKMVLIDL
jgi:hypothetical protein